jgi:hypothetical protein
LASSIAATMIDGPSEESGQRCRMAGVVSAAIVGVGAAAGGPLAGAQAETMTVAPSMTPAMARRATAGRNVREIMSGKVGEPAQWGRARERRHAPKERQLAQGRLPDRNTAHGSASGTPRARATGHAYALSRAAVAALRKEDPARVVGGVPVGAPETRNAFRDIADDIICAENPEPFRAVGWWYDDFPQTSDDEVHALLDHIRSLPQSSSARS